MREPVLLLVWAGKEGSRNGARYWECSSNAPSGVGTSLYERSIVPALFVCDSIGGGSPVRRRVVSSASTSSIGASAAEPLTSPEAAGRNPKEAPYCPNHAQRYGRRIHVRRIRHVIASCVPGAAQLRAGVLVGGLLGGTLGSVACPCPSVTLTLGSERGGELAYWRPRAARFSSASQRAHAWRVLRRPKALGIAHYVSYS